MKCSINYALWWCSTHDCGLDDHGHCKRARRKLNRAFARTRFALLKRFAETKLNPRLYGTITINPRKHMIELGSTVKDLITGYKGVVIGRCEWLHGCTRLIVEAEELKDGKPIEPQWFDEQRVELVKKPSAKLLKSLAAVKPEAPGGPQPDPKPAKAPSR